MRRALLVGLLAGLAAVVGAVQLARAGVVERIPITDSIRAGRDLPPGLVIELASPDEYTRATFAGSEGTWTGPRYQARSDPAVGGPTKIDWRVSFDTSTTTSSEQIVVRNLRQPTWRRDQRGGLSITRIVGKRVIGTILAEYYLLNPGGNDARFEGVLAFPLEQNLHAVVHLDLVEPESDSYVVKQSISASTWNRGQALLALARIRLRGNLAPKIVAARAVDKGRSVRGKVVDRFLAPVVGAPIALERQRGGSWARVARGKTSDRGFYTLKAGRRGAYRVTVNMAGFKAESRPLLAGRGRR
jgi:Carboxypeptidase regulatory-like domain